MEVRNFHTSLMGFRKRDVVNYLAEEKRLQEQALAELRAQARELEEQLDQARSDSSAGRLLTQELQGEVSDLRQQLELLQAELAAAREAQALAEHLLSRAQTEKQEAQDRLDRVETALTETEQLLETAQQQDMDARLSLEKKIDELQERLQQAEENAVRMPGYADSIVEMEALREALAEEKQRSAQLEACLAAQQPAKPIARPEGANSDQLWALCGKMERTIRQMEQMLDGPYRLTCYPDRPQREPEEPVPAEAPARPEPAPAQPRSTVSSLLQRVRGK